MSKSDLFAKILKVVSGETEIPEDVILSRDKSTEAVDARSILVGILCEYGLYPNQIASMMKRTPSSVRYLSTNLDERKRSHKMIDRFINNIRKQIGEY